MMTTAALNALLKKYSDAQIDILTSPDGQRVLKGVSPRVAVGTNLVALFGNIPPEESGAYVPQNQREFIHQGDGEKNTIATIPVETGYQSCLRFL